MNIIIKPNLKENKLKHRELHIFSNLQSYQYSNENLNPEDLVDSGVTHTLEVVCL